MARHAHTLLRVSLGYLLVIWGIDKVVDPAHGLAVSSRFYFGLFSLPSLMPAFGILEILLGLVVIAGLWRRFAYPALAIVTGMTLVGVWRSILDPWGWYLPGGNALFYPSLIIFASALVLLTQPPTHTPEGQS